MKIRQIVDPNKCDHIWLSDLEGLIDRHVSFVMVTIGDLTVEFDICTECGLITRLNRSYDPGPHFPIVDLPKADPVMDPVKVENVPVKIGRKKS